MNARVKRGEIRGAHVLWAMLAFFGLVIAVNVGFAVAAIRTFPGEDEPHSYLQGLHFNTTLSQRAAEANLGWRIDLSRTAQALTLRLVDGRGRPLSGAVVSATLRRPVTSQQDRAMTFTETTPGLYSAPAQLEPGLWEIRGAASRGSERLEFERRLQWRSSPTP